VHDAERATFLIDTDPAALIDALLARKSAAQAYLSLLRQGGGRPRKKPYGLD
jgi:hypothetical protein